jgi:hypothetical protein
VAGANLIGAGNAELGFRGQKFGRCGQRKQIIASQAPECSLDGKFRWGFMRLLYYPMAWNLIVQSIIQWLGT